METGSDNIERRGIEPGTLHDAGVMYAMPKNKKRNKRKNKKKKQYRKRKRRSIRIT